MRLLPVPKYRANCKFNRSKGIVLMTLATNPGWYRPVVISNATGLSLGSLLVLMAKWSGHGYLGKHWRLLERRLEPVTLNTDFQTMVNGIFANTMKSCR